MGGANSTEGNQKKDEKRKNIAREILQTEESYVLSLMTVAEIYIMPLTDALSGKPILTDQEIKSIFSFWNGILEFHLKFLKPQIHGRIERWSSTQCIGDVFVKNGDALKCYVTYVNNFDSVHQKIDQFNKKKDFKSFLLEAKKSPRHTQLDLMAYLIMPIQRIPRYVMLLRDLLKNTDPGHPDYDNLTKAVEKVESVAKYINEMKRDDENSKKVVAISQTIEGRFEEPLVKPHRRFIREGKLELKKVGVKKSVTESSREKRSTILSIFERMVKRPSKKGFLIFNDGEGGLGRLLISLGGILSSDRKRWVSVEEGWLSVYENEEDEKIDRFIQKYDLSRVKLLTEEEKKTKGKLNNLIVLESENNLLVTLKGETDPIHQEWVTFMQQAIEEAKPKLNGDVFDDPSFVDGTKFLGLPPGSYYIFLFNDMALQCTEKLTKGYKLRGSQTFKEGQYIKKISDDTFCFGSDEFILYFSDTKENIAKWADDFQKTLNAYKKDPSQVDRSQSSVWNNMSSFFSG